MSPEDKERAKTAIERIDQQIGLIRDDFDDEKYEDALSLVNDLVFDARNLERILETEDESPATPEVP